MNQEVPSGEQAEYGPLSAPKTFDVLLDALKDAYKEFVDANQKIAALLMIVIGWFAAKENPLDMLCHVPFLPQLSVALCLAGFPALVYLLSSIYLRGRTCYQMLQERYEEYLFQRYRLSRMLLGSGLLGQMSLLLGIAALLVVKYVMRRSVTCG